MKRGGSIIYYLLIVLLMVRDYVPFVLSKVSTLSSILLLGISFLFFTQDLGQRPYLKYAPMFAIPIFDIAVSFIFFEDDIFIVSIYAFAQFFIYALVCEFIKRHSQEKEMRWLSLFFFAIILITTVTTYWGNLMLPGASRNMASGLKDDRELMAFYGSLNIGGFGFVYFLVLIQAFLFYFFKNYSRGLIIRILVLLIILFNFLSIYTTEYSTAIIAVLLSIAILLLPDRLTPQRKFLYVGIAIMCVGSLLPYFLPGLLDEFSSLTESRNVSIRMEEVGNIMEGEATYGDVSKRIELWKESLYNFFENPLYGTGDSGGGHSFLLDTLSKYGMIGLILIVIQLKATYTIFVKPYLKTEYATLFLFVFMLNLFLSVVNTIFFYNIFLLCMPLFLSFYTKETAVKSDRKK